MSLLAQLLGLFWTIIHGVIQLAFSAIKKVMQRWRPLHVHAANTIRKLCLGDCDLLKCCVFFMPSSFFYYWCIWWQV